VTVSLPQSNAGKTALLNRFCDEKFTSTYISTVGVDFKNKIMLIEGERVKVQVWDTAGQERFRSISMSFLRGSQGIALVFDLTERRSFDNVRNWMRQVKDGLSDSFASVLLANKADLTEKHAVAEDEARDVAKAMGVRIFFTSAKSGTQVAEALEYLAQEATKIAMENKTKSPQTPAGGAVSLTPSSEKKPASSGGCKCG
jgi:Ras-related protein Rab-8A